MNDFYSDSKKTMYTFLAELPFKSDKRTNSYFQENNEQVSPGILGFWSCAGQTIVPEAPKLCKQFQLS